MSTLSSYTRSHALDAYRAKNDDARSRLAVDFVAFIQTPEKKKVSGYIVYATMGSCGVVEDENYEYSAYVVGNPSVQVGDCEGSIHYFHDESVERTNWRDVHTSMIVAMLSNANSSDLENVEVPRAIGVEVIFLDTSFGQVYRCSYDGLTGGTSVNRRTKRLVLTGCYDESVRRKVKSLLKGMQKKRQTSKSLQAVMKELKRVTGATSVGYYKVSF